MQTLDLNQPSHARIYIKTWVDTGELVIGVTPIDQLRLDHASDEDNLRVAKQLFLYCDPRPPLGKVDEPH